MALRTSIANYNTVNLKEIPTDARVGVACDRHHCASGDTRGRAACRAPGRRGGRSHHKGDGCWSRLWRSPTVGPGAARTKRRQRQKRTRVLGFLNHLHFWLVLHCFSETPADTSPFPGFPESSPGSCSHKAQSQRSWASWAALVNGHGTKHTGA
jgi:hypothetical protein